MLYIKSIRYFELSLWPIFAEDSCFLHALRTPSCNRLQKIAPDVFLVSARLVRFLVTSIKGILRHTRRETYREPSEPIICPRKWPFKLHAALVYGIQAYPADEIFDRIHGKNALVLDVATHVFGGRCIY